MISENLQRMFIIFLSFDSSVHDKDKNLSHDLHSARWRSKSLTCITEEVAQRGTTARSCMDLGRRSFSDEISIVLTICSEVIVCSTAGDASGNQLAVISWCWISIRSGVRGFNGSFRSLTTPKKVAQRALPTAAADATPHSLCFFRSESPKNPMREVGIDGSM